MKKLIVLFLLFLLSGCVGPVKELKYQIEDGLNSDALEGTPSTLSDITNNKRIEILWTASIGSQTLWDSKNESQEAAPIDIFIYEEFLFTLSHDGKVKKINLSDGKSVWEKSFDFKVTAGLSGDSDYLLFVSNEGELWCLDHNGKELWKTYVGGKVAVSPLVYSTFVTVKLNNNKFVQLNILDGSIKWEYQSATPPLTINFQGKMIFSDGVLYSGLPVGKLLAIEAETGSLIWEATVSQSKGVTEIDRANDITSQPVIDKSIIYAISSNGGKINAIDRRTAQSLWDRPLSSFVGLNLYGNDVIVVHETNSIYSLDNEAGKTNWRNIDLQYRNIGRGVIIGDSFAVGDFAGYLHFINLIDGKLTNRIRLSDSQITNNIIAINEHKLIVMDLNGNIYCLEIN